MVQANIGVFDSGVGGLSVLRALWHELPGRSFLYVADSAHCPYGARSPEIIRNWAEGISRFLIDRGAQVIVVACNTASAAALWTLRQRFPHVPFVGMVPAVKPAARQSRTGVIGVLATPGTFDGKLYREVISQHARGKQVVARACHGLVELIEDGAIRALETRRLLRQCLDPLVRAGADVLVLGCTHYPFVLELIREIVGPDVTIIEPSVPVARQVRRVLEQVGLGSESGIESSTRFYTTGQLDAFRHLTELLVGPQAGSFSQLLWKGASLVEGQIDEFSKGDGRIWRSRS